MVMESKVEFNDIHDFLFIYLFFGGPTDPIFLRETRNQIGLA